MIEYATSIGLYVYPLMGQEATPKADVAWIFVPGKTLIKPEQVLHLPTKM
jgi:hypothetical protein